MAKLLYRIGRLAASRPLLVVLGWILIIGMTAGAMTAFAKPMTNTFSLPGSEFSRTLDHLGKTIPAVAGGTGSVVIHSERPFTADDREALAAIEKKWEQKSFVKEVLDPFETQATIDRSKTDLQDAKAKLDEGQQKYDDGRYQLDRLRWLVAQGKADIARLQRTNPDDPTLKARIDGQAGLEQKLSDGDAQLAESKTQLDDGWQQYADGSELSSFTKGVRTVSKDGRTALVQLRLHKSTHEIDPKVMKSIVTTGDQIKDDGLQIEYGQELTQATVSGGTGEIIGLIVAGSVLLLMFGSLILAGLPLVAAFVTVAVALMGALAFSPLVQIQQMAPVLGAMLGLAVGIDYSLFIVNRHRRQLIHLVADTQRLPARSDIVHSVALAMGTAGSAVVVAGATVIISLAALAVAGIPSLHQMGALAAAAVAMAVVVSSSLTPALLSLVGNRALPRRIRRAFPRTAGDTAATVTVPAQRTAPVVAKDPHRMATRWVSLVTKHAGATVLAVVALLGVVALPAAQLQLGLPDGGNEPADSTAYKSFTLIEEAFGAGANGPVIVAADYKKPLADKEKLASELAIAREIKAIPGTSAVVPIGISKDRRTLAFQVVPEAGPSSKETLFLVHAIRDDVKKTFAAQDIKIGVTGATVANIEVSDRLDSAMLPYLALVIGLSLLLLTVVFRSVVVPLLATAGFLLSVAAAFGAIVAVYQWGWLGAVFDVHRSGPVFSFMPTILIGILFGLAMDYQMFLVSGMHEAYAHGEKAVQAVRSGFIHGARVVFAAGLIMVSVFGGFVYTEMTMSRPIALGLTIGVLVDAFVVRMTLTPAAMKLLGDRAWWLPEWLERVLPHVDVEGAALARDGAAPSDSREDRREDALV